MIFDKPYVNGINMKEVNQIVSSYVDSSLDAKRVVFMFLDCCHSAVTIQGEKAAGDDSVNFADKLSNEIAGDGRAILVSSDADESSREKKDCIDLINDTPNEQGIFTS